MEQRQTRRTNHLKTLKRFDQYSKKAIIGYLSWIELSVVLIICVSICFILIYWNFAWKDKGILIGVLLLLVSLICIKINKMNFFVFVYLNLKYFLNKQDYLDKKYWQSTLLHFEDNQIVFNQQKWNIKKLTFKVTSETKCQNILDQYDFLLDEQLECFLLVFNNENYLTSYLGDLKHQIKINQALQEKDFLIHHEIEAELINNLSIKKNIFLCYKNEQDLKLIQDLVILNDLNEQQKIMVENQLKNVKVNKIHQNYFKNQKTYTSLLSISKLKPKLEIAWLINFINEQNNDLIIHLHALHKLNSLKLLKNMQKTFYINKKKQQILQKENSLIQQYLNQVEENNNFLISCQIILFVHENNVKQLKKKIKTLTKNFVQQEIKCEIVKYYQLDLLNFNNWDKEALEKYFGVYINFKQLKIGLINLHQHFIDQNGILLGVDALNKPFVVNQAQYLLNNQHYFNGISLILGKSGSGKSFLLKKMIYLNSLIKKQKIFVFDVENEYSILKKWINDAAIIETIPCCIDPFLLKFSNQTEQILFLNDFLNNLFAQTLNWTKDLHDFLNKEQKRHFWIFLKWVQNKYDFIQEFINNEFYKNWFKQNFDWERNLIIFNFKKLFTLQINNKQQIMQAILMMILNIIAYQVFNNKDKVLHIFIDEAHNFFNSKNSCINDIWINLIKKSRKYQTLLTFATQNFDDLLNNEYGIKIIENAQFNLIGKLNDYDAKNWINSLNKNEDTLNNLLQQIQMLHKGEFIFNVNEQFCKIKNTIWNDVYWKFYQKENQED